MEIKVGTKIDPTGFKDDSFLFLGELRKKGNYVVTSRSCKKVLFITKNKNDASIFFSKHVIKRGGALLLSPLVVKRMTKEDFREMEKSGRQLSLARGW